MELKLPPLSTRDIPPGIEVELGARSYGVEFSDDIATSVLGFLETLRPQAENVFLFTDSNVYLPWARHLLDAIRSRGYRITEIVIPPGEDRKEISTISEAWDTCLESGCNRQSVIIALGGGVVGDMAGFVAATLLRGIRLLQIPTTLLAMVDSSVGGKTGINHNTGKNLIGAFYQPERVLVCPNCLETLPAAEFKSGMAEVIKYGIIADAGFFDYLEEVSHDLTPKDSDQLRAVIARCIEIKSAVVGVDEREGGVRAILNFGHTIGHALESVTGYSVYRHGEAVAVGMVGAGILAVQKNLWTTGDLDRLANLLKRAGLPTSIDRQLDKALILEAMSADKKVRAGRLRFVLPDRIGSVGIYDDVDDKSVLAALDFLLPSPPQAASSEQEG